MELPDYRDNLDTVLSATGGKLMLSAADVCRITGLVDRRTVKKRFPIENGMISAATLARAMCSERRSK